MDEYDVVALAKRLGYTFEELKEMIEEKVEESSKMAENKNKSNNKK